MALAEPAQDTTPAADLPEYRQDWWVRALGWALLAGFLAFIVFAGAWRVTGGRWEVVQTASMGTTAPVGSLLWTRPADAEDLKVGDFISFHPPGRATVTYSHRILAVNDDGTLQTKGDIPGPDPWRVQHSDVIGEVTMVWRGVGWIVTAAPILLVAAAIVLLVRRAARRDYRLPITLVLVALAIDVVLVWYQPLTNAQLVGSRTGSDGVHASFVNTGLLPVRVTGVGGSEVVISSGEVGGVRTDVVGEDNRYHVDFDQATPWWFWLLLILLCFGLPLYWLIVGVPIDPAIAGGKRRDDTAR